MNNPFKKKTNPPIRVSGRQPTNIATFSKSVVVAGKTYKKGDTLPPGITVEWRK